MVTRCSVYRRGRGSSEGVFGRIFGIGTIQEREGAPDLANSRKWGTLVFERKSADFTA
jgi:hypothetical protein